MINEDFQRKKAICYIDQTDNHSILCAYNVYMHFYYKRSGGAKFLDPNKSIESQRPPDEDIPHTTLDSTNPHEFSLLNVDVINHHIKKPLHRVEIAKDLHREIMVPVRKIYQLNVLTFDENLSDDKIFLQFEKEYLEDLAVEQQQFKELYEILKGDNRLFIEDISITEDGYLKEASGPFWW